MSDDYDEDAPVPDAPAINEKSDSEYQSEVTNREREVTKLLNGGSALKALPVALENPPTHCKVQEVKDQNTTIVLNVLAGLKDKDFDAAVNSLDADQLDVLMKYIYKGLATGENSTPLLKLHELVLKKAGLGSIVRALTERKTV